MSTSEVTRTRTKARGLSFAAAAAELGMSPQGLRKHEQAGHVVRFPDRSVDLEATRARIDAMRDTRGGKREPLTETGPLDVAALGSASELADRIRELAGLSDLERRKRLDIAKVLLTEQQAEGERLKVEQVKANLVPAAEAVRVAEAGARLIQASFDAEVESGAVELNAKYAISLIDGRAFLREWYRRVLTSCAEHATKRGFDE